MKLIVCSTRDQQMNLKREFPDDLVKVVGDALYGYQVTEIVDRTFLAHPRSHQWWEHAQCRVKR